MISGVEMERLNGYVRDWRKNICVVYSCTGIARNINKFIEEMKGRKNADVGRQRGVCIACIFVCVYVDKELNVWWMGIGWADRREKILAKICVYILYRRGWCFVDNI